MLLVLSSLRSLIALLMVAGNSRLGVMDVYAADVHSLGFCEKRGTEIKECLPGDLPGAFSTGRFGLLLALSPWRPAD